MNSFAITNAAVVLPREIIQGGAVAVRDGVITQVARSASALGQRPDHQIDADGAYLMPGIVDLHNDGLEFEANPRPNANLPLELALDTLERRLVAAGVTTELHAIAFMERASTARTVSGAVRNSDYIAGLAGAPRAVDHQILHRLDVWSPQNMDDVFHSLARMPVRYLSLNDHTPGQGQFGDLDVYVKRMEAYRDQRGTAGPDVAALRELIAERAADSETLAGVHARVRAEAAALPMVIATHDDDSAAKVDLGWELGARVAEFPVNVQAAERARQLGMPIVVGAPNIVRGGSQSGNVDAVELFRLGLADIICADYHPPSLLPAAFSLVEHGVLDLPAAIRTLTLNPARAVGLDDRGAIELGLAADLIVVRPSASGLPFVEAAFRAGRAVFSFSPRSLTPTPSTVAVGS